MWPFTLVAREITTFELSYEFSLQATLTRWRGRYENTMMEFIVQEMWEGHFFEDMGVGGFDWDEDMEITEWHLQDAAYLEVGLQSPMSQDQKDRLAQLIQEHDPDHRRVWFREIEAARKPQRKTRRKKTDQLVFGFMADEADEADDDALDDVYMAMSLRTTTEEWYGVPQTHQDPQRDLLLNAPVQRGVLETIELPKAFIANWIAAQHRHCTLLKHGVQFADAVRDRTTGKIVGAIQAKNPVSRNMDDGKTLEISRVATDGTANACTWLMGRARRWAKADGRFDRIITYTLEHEPGASLRAANFKEVALVRPRAPRRKGSEAPTGAKRRWEIRLRHNPNKK